MTEQKFCGRWYDRVSDEPRAGDVIDFFDRGMRTMRVALVKKRTVECRGSHCVIRVPRENVLRVWRRRSGS